MSALLPKEKTQEKRIENLQPQFPNENSVVIGILRKDTDHC
jgi:hypothetical protein